jgi:hypothetical protein
MEYNKYMTTPLFSGQIFSRTWPSSGPTAEWKCYKAHMYSQSLNALMHVQCILSMMARVLPLPWMTGATPLRGSINCSMGRFSNWIQYILNLGMCFNTLIQYLLLLLINCRIWNSNSVLMVFSWCCCIFLHWHHPLIKLDTCWTHLFIYKVRCFITSMRARRIYLPIGCHDFLKQICCWKYFLLVLYV